MKEAEARRQNLRAKGAAPSTAAGGGAYHVTGAHNNKKKDEATVLVGASGGGGGGGGGGRDRKTNRTTRMLLVVVVLFLVTEFPQGVINLLSGVLDHFVGEVYMALGDLLDILALINNGINFILYCTMSKQFRDTFVHCFRLESVAAAIGRCIGKGKGGIDGGACGAGADHGQLLLLPATKDDDVARKQGPPGPATMPTKTENGGATTAALHASSVGELTISASSDV